MGGIGLLLQPFCAPLAWCEHMSLLICADQATLKAIISVLHMNGHI